LLSLQDAKIDEWVTGPHGSGILISRFKQQCPKMESLGSSLGGSVVQSRKAAPLASFSHTPPAAQDDHVSERDKQRAWLWSRKEEMLLPSAAGQVWYAWEQVLGGSDPAS